MTERLTRGGNFLEGRGARVTQFSLYVLQLLKFSMDMKFRDMYSTSIISCPKNFERKSIYEFCVIAVFVEVALTNF